MEIMRRMYI
jgi:hypothetical protein